MDINKLRSWLQGEKTEGLPEREADKKPAAAVAQPKKSKELWADWERRGKCRIAKDRSDALMEFGKYTGKLVSDIVNSEDGREYLNWIASEYNKTRSWPPLPLVEIIRKHIKKAVAQ